MNCPTVSVIIPCYNSAIHIEETLRSVFEQTYENITVIAIDDGSTDNTRTILHKYCDRMKIVTHDRNINKGVAASLNLGLCLATTDLIAFIDHDDIWYPDKIKRQVECFLQNSEVDLVYCNGDVIDESGQRVYKIFSESHQDVNDPGRLLLDCYIKSCTMVMLTRRVIERVGFFNEKLLTTDHDMWLRIQEVATIQYLNDCLVGYREHQHQNSLRRILWEDGFIILAEACKRYPYTRVQKKKRLAVLYYRLGEHDLKSKKILSAGYNFLRAFLNDPARAMVHLAP